MTAPCEFLGWDTDFFGYRIGKSTVNELDQVRMDAIVAWCLENAIDCLYFLANPDHPQTAQLLTANRFALVDIRLTLEKHDLATWQPFMPTMTIRPYHESDMPQLKAIARHSYRASRFYFDTHFSEVICDAFYETWIEKSCHGYADEVLVCEIANQPVGFVTCSAKATNGNIGLVGVDASIRGKGIGYQLLMASMNWFHDRACVTVDVVTQGRNISAQRLYQRCGFMTKSVELWYHFWTQNGK